MNISGIKALLNANIQTHASIAEDHYRAEAKEAANEHDRLTAEARREEANAIYWIQSAEFWGNLAESARDRDFGDAVEAGFRAREHDAQADLAAAKAEIAYDRSVHYREVRDATPYED